MFNATDLFQKIFMSLLIGVVAYAAKEIGEMSNSVQNLNVKMAVMVEQIQTHNKRFESQDARLHGLDKRMDDIERHVIRSINNKER